MSRSTFRGPKNCGDLHDPLDPMWLAQVEQTVGTTSYRHILHFSSADRKLFMSKTLGELPDLEVADEEMNEE